MSSKSFGLNKILAIAPVWFAAQKIDWSDDAVLTKFRFGFLGEVIGFFGLTAYLCFKIQRVAEKEKSRIIFVRPKPSYQNPKPTGWAKTNYYIYETAELFTLAQQMLFVVALSLVLHFYLELKQSLLMQAVMLPMTFMEHPTVRKHLLGAYFPEARPYGEKFEGEELPETEEEANTRAELKAAAAAAACGCLELLLSTERRGKHRSAV